MSRMTKSTSAPSHESPEARFLQELATGVPKVQECQACGLHFFQPRTHCPSCKGAVYQWVVMDLLGTIYSYSTIPAKGEQPSYNVVLVDMDEGFRMMSTCPGMQLQADCIGARVQASVDTDSQPARLVFVEAQ